MDSVPLSHRLAIESGLFEDRQGYIRPASRDIAHELCSHFQQRHHDLGQIMVKAANLTNREALVIGGTDYTLEQLARFLKVDLEAERFNDIVQARPTPTLESACRDRFIPSQGLEDAPVSLHEKTVENSGNPFEVHEWAFVYPSGLTHFIGVKPTANGDIIQRWEPKGQRKSDPSLWTWRQPTQTNPDRQTAYLCEGEKDALALGQCGFLAFGVPGSGAFKAESAAWLADQLAENHPEVSRIRLCFDADSAGKKGTELALARLANHHQFAIEMLQWPTGTASGTDVGDVLKEHRAAFPRVILEMTWINPYALKASQPVEIVEVKESRVWVRENLIERRSDGYLLWTENNAGDDVGTQLTNFTFDVLREYEIDENGQPRAEYAIKLKNGKRTSRQFQVPGSAFADPTTFIRTCANQGQFLTYSLPRHVLSIICEYEMSHERVILVRRLDGFGWFPKIKAYASPSMMIADGESISPDDDGHFELDGHTYIVDPPYRFLQGSEPDWRHSEYDDGLDGLCRDFLTACDKLIGRNDDHHGLLVAGWFASTFYSDVFFPKRFSAPKVQHGRAFPYLMVTGKKGSGKTEGIGHLFRGLSGYDATGDSFSESTQDYMNKALYANRNLPMWFDEIEKGSKIRAGALKTVYNRSSAGKGTKQGVRTLDIHGCLILMGEEKLSEVSERSILVTFHHDTERTEANREGFRWLSRHGEYLPALAVEIMRERTSDFEAANEAYLADVARWSKQLLAMAPTAPERIIGNYAKVLAGLALYPIEDATVVEARDHGTGPFAEWLAKEMRRVLDIRNDLDIILQGLELALGQDCPAYRVGKRILIPTGQLRRTLDRTSINLNQFMEAFTTAPYYNKKYSESLVVDGEKRKVHCHVLDAEHPALPEYLSTVLEHATESVG